MRTPSLNSHTRAFWLFIAPSLMLFLVFFLLPLCLSLGFSFTNYDGWKRLGYTGLENYWRVLTSAEFYRAVWRTCVYTIGNLPFKIGIPLFFALILSSHLMIGKNLVRTLVYIPVLLSALVAGITINWIFGEEYGLINFILQSMGLNKLRWASDPTLAAIVVSIASNWSSTGYYMLLYIGGILNIPHELYEAASTDGARPAQTFFRITLPLLAPTTCIVLFLSTVGLLKEYALVQGISSGGPGTATTYIVQYIFDKGFNQYQYGLASAMGVIVSLLFIVIALVQFKFTKGGEL